MPHHHTPSSNLSRRHFLAASAGSALLLPQIAAYSADSSEGPQQATGTRVGEVTDRSAIVWTRLTRFAQRNDSGVLYDGKVDKQKPVTVTVPADQIEGACPAAPGRVRLRYAPNSDLTDAVVTEWVDVTVAEDGIHQFELTGLQPDTTYHYVSEAAADGGSTVTSELRGRFSMAPAAAAPGNFRFCVMTCQGYPDRDHPDGHPIYPSMQALEPRFLSMTGDLVYYDSNEPRAVTPALARLHWERMFSLPRIRDMLRSTATYWLKDDHDLLTNDVWPGMQAGELTFAEGQAIFRQQAPLHAGAPSYRTFRWGRDLQVWFTDGRDFRSANDIADGPDKTIWGTEQMAWFQRTVRESDATWKVLISPTPLVGPDRTTKNDNHSNPGFTHEGDEIRAWLKEHVPDNFFVVCGDRHWQYHSVHPQTGLNEFSVGPASDSHASGTPGENPEYHRFHRVQGGFLCVELTSEGSESQIAFQLRNVDGGIAHEAKFRRAVS